MPLKLISCLKYLKLPAGLFRSSMETGKSRKNVYLLKYCYHWLHEFSEEMCFVNPSENINLILYMYM